MCSGLACSIQRLHIAIIRPSLVTSRIQQEENWIWILNTQTKKPLAFAKGFSVNWEPAGLAARDWPSSGVLLSYGGEER